VGQILLIAAGSATKNPDPNTIGPTFTVDTGTEVVTTAVAHGRTTGQKIQVVAGSGGTLPTGLSASTDYYVRVLSTTTFTLHPTEADATNNTNTVNITAAGTPPYHVVTTPVWPYAPDLHDPKTTTSAPWAAMVAAGTYAPAILPIVSNSRDGAEPKVKLTCVPSGGAAVTYNVTAWRYNDSVHRYDTTARCWSKPADVSVYAATGEVTIELNNPGVEPWFFQLDTISTGTVEMWVEGAYVL
jgi:hypothetical protein